MSALEIQPVTPVTYLAEMIAMSWRHGSELAVALICVVVGVTAFAARSSVHLLPILLAVGAALLFEVGMAAWRVYRRQHVVIATARSLLDSNASDRGDLEQHRADDDGWPVMALRGQGGIG